MRCPSTVLLILAWLGAPAGAAGLADGYRSPAEVAEALDGLVAAHPDSARVHRLGRSAGGRPLLLLELGSAPGKGAERPGVLVLANLAGDCPPASEAALLLADRLLGEWSEALARYRWYLLPVGNPDGYARFFERPLGERAGNARAINEDHDERADEDGPTDLNGDGLVTWMRQLHPQGEWLEVEGKPGLMKKARRARGERGRYRLFVEGTDKDGDGRIAEDGPGGVDPDRNFPHAFQHFTSQGGLFPASEPESRAVLEWAYGHPRIAMVLVLGRSNTLLEVPAGSGPQVASPKRYRVPRELAEQVGLDPEAEYPLAELMAIRRELTGNPDLSEAMVLQWLRVGAATRPAAEDAAYWKQICERYAAFLKAAGLAGARQEPLAPGPGSAAAWAYFQFGVPAFALDPWWLPGLEPAAVAGLPGPDELQAMEPGQIVALGTATLSRLIEAAGAAARYGPEELIAALQSGTLTPGRLAGLLRAGLIEKAAAGADPAEVALQRTRPAAFLPFRPFEHPTLGPVEIGGRRPWALWAPPVAEARRRAAKLLPFVRELAGLLPRVELSRVDVEPRSGDVWLVEAWVSNAGLLPYPTHQGQRCQRPSPLVVTAKGAGLRFIEGRPRAVLGQLPGSGGALEARWLIQARPGTRLALEVEGWAAGAARREVVLGKGGGR